MRHYRYMPVRLRLPEGEGYGAACLSRFTPDHAHRLSGRRGRILHREAIHGIKYRARDFLFSINPNEEADCSVDVYTSMQFCPEMGCRHQHGCICNNGTRYPG